MGDANLNTNLKKFQRSLDRIELHKNKIQMLEDCAKAYNDSGTTTFSGTETCYKLSSNPDKVTLMGSDYTKFPESAYTILHGINAHTVSYKKLLDSAVISGYDGATDTLRDIVDLSGSLHGGKFDNEDLQIQHSSVKLLRDELDNKMRNIYNPEDQDEYKSNEQSVYLTLSWTVVATSVLYFLFVKL